MTVLNAIFPIFSLLFLGSLLKHFNITNETFLKTSDRLVYFIFFPVMLFWKIGSSTPDKGVSLNLCLAAIMAVIIVYLLSLAAIRLFHISSFQAGSFSQACYRFNTYIGMAIVMTTLGESGVRYFGILIGFAIPIINMLAVSTLIWHSGEKQIFGQNLKVLLKALISNPLILGCAAGILFSRSQVSFPIFIDNTFSLMTAVTMPLALISIGGSLTLTGLKHNTKFSLIASGLKILILPVIGFFLLKIFCVTGVPFKAGMIFFTLPTSTAIYVLSAQLNSDTQLASAAIMLSTLLSFISLSVALLI
ncbi:MAG: AEC family transporter [Desulfobacula sp.]|uniref:AEC family transporter n=1 Tax=Desulfobacula sp. TaxID=2593537 RepID=UPI0025BCD997|nr:AEC family transporter [Desulfobacula sp.]MCD4723116.1 AEC family transporter [Desulfobacula sp.]